MAEKEYIEREALWRAFEYEPFYDNADRDEIVLPKIDAFPAADVEPARHGRWYWAKDGHCKCSVCEQYATVKRLVVKTNYCPNCGAKMDLEGGNA